MLRRGHVIEHPPVPNGESNAQCGKHPYHDSKELEAGVVGLGRRKDVKGFLGHATIFSYGTISRSKLHNKAWSGGEPQDLNRIGKERIEPEVPRAAAQKASPRQKAGRVRNPASKPKTGRANKKAEVIPMMKRAKGATLTEIIVAMK
jgi:hypothetical protein